MTNTLVSARDILRELLFDAWEYDMWRGILLRLADGARGVLSHTVRVILYRGMSLAGIELCESQGDPMWDFAMHTFSLPWLEAYYLDALPTTAALRWVLGMRLVPSLFSAALLPAPCQAESRYYVEAYLTREPSVLNAFLFTLMRHALPALATAIHTAVTLPAINYFLPRADIGYLGEFPQRLHLIHCAFDAFGTTAVRSTGAAVGAWVFRTAFGCRHAHYGMHWGGLLAYAAYSTRVLRAMRLAKDAEIASMGPGGVSGEENAQQERVTTLFDRAVDAVMRWGGGAVFWRAAGEADTETPEESYQNFAAESAGKGEEAETYYECLGVAKESRPEEVQKAFRKLALTNHPDRLHHLSKEEREVSEDRMKHITHAYNNLKDERKRRIYDAYLDDRASGRVPAMPRRQSSGSSDAGDAEGGAARAEEGGGGDAEAGGEAEGGGGAPQEWDGSSPAEEMVDALIRLMQTEEAAKVGRACQACATGLMLYVYSMSYYQSLAHGGILLSIS